MKLEREQAAYEVCLVARRYEAVDPDNRPLVEPASGCAPAPASI
ncbi:hypothetical protein WME91_19185 [Sorangium sp. So ce269]